ncbi:hypothetical protein EC991_009285 [Linnemannia zychae]|nr:hypothetical protein EC991_009285 [Linnemannia zychae]
MTDNRLNFLCLVDDESTSFPVEIEPTKTIGDLKDAIKAKKINDFSDVDADELTLWRVSIPLVAKKDRKDISLSDVPLKEELDETDDHSDVFPVKLPEKTIHIIVQRPPDDLRANIKRITERFFTPGLDVTKFLGTFVKGSVASWVGKPPETRPSLLFMDLPNPSAPDTASRNLAAGSILDMVKENNRQVTSFFGVSGCGKTPAVIELLSQHWGFYFNASNDDWGSDDMMTLRSAVQKYLNDTRGSFIVDPEANNGYARKTTILLFLSRLLVFKYCLNASVSSEPFTSARWTLLQLLNLRHFHESNLWDFVRAMYEETKGNLIEHGCIWEAKRELKEFSDMDVSF